MQSPLVVLIENKRKLKKDYSGTENIIHFLKNAKLFSKIYSLDFIILTWFQKNNKYYCICLIYYIQFMWRKKKENLGSRIKRLRKEKGFTQEELAQKANLTYINFVKIERGLIPNPWLQAVYKIAKSLDTDLNTLVEGIFNDEKLLNTDN